MDILEYFLWIPMNTLRQWAITWTNVDPQVYHHMASLGHNKLSGRFTSEMHTIHIVTNEVRYDNQFTNIRHCCFFLKQVLITAEFSYD